MRSDKGFGHLPTFEPLFENFLKSVQEIPMTLFNTFLKSFRELVKSGQNTPNPIPNPIPSGALPIREENNAFNEEEAVI